MRWSSLRPTWARGTRRWPRRSTTNTAGVLEAQGELDKARELYEQALAIAKTETFDDVSVSEDEQDEEDES
jgi:hypothetical protein